MAEGNISLSYDNAIRVGSPLNLFRIFLWASLLLQSLNPKYNPTIDGCAEAKSSLQRPDVFKRRHFLNQITKYNMRIRVSIPLIRVPSTTLNHGLTAQEQHTVRRALVLSHITNMLI
jgi:hypothetical protein